MSLVFQDCEKEKAKYNLAIFVIATLAYNLIALVVNTVVGVFIPNTPIDTALCLLVYFYLLLRALPTIIKRITANDLIFILATAAVLSLSMLTGDNFGYIIDALSVFPQVFLYYFLGKSILNDDYIEKLMFKATPYVILLSFALFFFNIIFSKTQNEDNMSLAYYLLPFSIFSAFKMVRVKENRLCNISVFIGALFLQVWTGTRGPLLCLFCALTLYILVTPNKKSTKISFALIMACLLVFLSSNMFFDFMKNVSIFLEEKGVSNRIVDKFLQEELLDASGRDNITEKILVAIKEGPAFGYGLFGDRALLNGSYCHNIFYELLVNFGVLIGGALFITLVISLATSLFRTKVNSAFYTMLLCAGFIKLFLSSSYIIDPMFFMLLGALFSTGNAKKDAFYSRS